VGEGGGGETSVGVRLPVETKERRKGRIVRSGRFDPWGVVEKAGRRWHFLSVSEKQKVQKEEKKDKLCVMNAGKGDVKKKVGILRGKGKCGGTGTVKVLRNVDSGGRRRNCPARLSLILAWESEGWGVRSQSWKSANRVVVEADLGKKWGWWGIPAL